MKPTDEMVEAGAKALNTYFCYSALEVDGTCMHSAPIADCHLCRAVIDVDRDKARAVLTAALASQPEAGAGDDDPPCTDCGDTGVTYQTERRCACQPAPAPSGKPEAGAGDGLLPCPFCGHPATLNSVAEGTAIECSGCSAEVIASADETAKLLWNARVMPPPPCPSRM